MTCKKSYNFRIFVGPVEISGVAKGIVDGMQEIGVEAKTQLSFQHPFKYEKGPNDWFIWCWQQLGTLRLRQSPQKLLLKAFFYIVHYLWGWLILLKSLREFDVFIFLFGQTMTNSKFELWLLKKLKKKIVFVYLGSDARPPYIDGSIFQGAIDAPLPSGKTIYSTTLAHKKRIKYHERYADYLINSPSTAHFHERPYINWFCIGFPRDFQTTYNEKERKNHLIRILHSPSNHSAKGTKFIVDLIENLKARGYLVELIMIKGMPNSCVLEELASCDFVIDQVYSDTPLAGFATEAAFWGKPTIVGGYFSVLIEDFIKKESIPPSLYVEPDELEAAVLRLITDIDFRQTLGKRAQEFVTTQWCARAVAERYLRLLQDDVPSHWWSDPNAVQYVDGCGLPRARTQQLVKQLLMYGGVPALQLSDKPRLENAFIDFARAAKEC